MANDFGALTDHFGILAIADGGGVLGDKIELIESTLTPLAESRADAEDENGDVVASTYYGNDGGTIKEASSTFLIKTGTVDISLLKLGELATGKVVESIEITTSNKDWPKITVSGKLGMTALQKPTGKAATAKLPDLDIVGARRAQEISFSIGAGGRLTASSLKASGKISQANNGMGEPVAFAVNFENCEVTATQVRVSAAPTVTVSGSLVQTQGVSTGEPGPEYHTAEWKGEIPLTRDSA